MKKVFLLCMIGIFAAGFTLSAQPSKPHKGERPEMPSVQQIIEKKWEFISSQITLTPEVSEQLKTAFFSFETSMFEMNKRDMTARRAMKNLENLSEEEYKQINTKMLQSIEERQELFVNHCRHLETILTPKQFYQYMEAEKNFKRTLFGSKEKCKVPHPACPMEHKAK